MTITGIYLTHIKAFIKNMKVTYMDLPDIYTSHFRIS